MRLLALLIALIVCLLLGLAIRAKVDFRYKRADEEDHVEIILSALYGLWKFKMEVPTIQLEWEKGPQLDIEHKVNPAAGSPKSSKGHVRFRYLNLNFLYHLWPKLPDLFFRLNQIKKQFYRGIKCTELDWRLSIGYQDPSQTALAAGAFWAAGGYSLARLYKQITMKVEEPVFKVVPQFQKKGFSCDIHCIFHLRIGHIMFAGFNLMRTFNQLGRRG